MRKGYFIAMLVAAGCGTIPQSINLPPKKLKLFATAHIPSKPNAKLAPLRMDTPTIEKLSRSMALAAATNCVTRWGKPCGTGNNTYNGRVTLLYNLMCNADIMYERVVIESRTNMQSPWQVKTQNMVFLFNGINTFSNTFTATNSQEFYRVGVKRT